MNRKSFRFRPIVWFKLALKEYTSTHEGPRLKSSEIINIESICIDSISSSRAVSLKIHSLISIHVEYKVAGEQSHSYNHINQAYGTLTIRQQINVIYDPTEQNEKFCP